MSAVIISASSFNAKSHLVYTNCAVYGSAGDDVDVEFLELHQKNQAH